MGGNTKKRNPNTFQNLYPLGSVTKLSMPSEYCGYTELIKCLLGVVINLIYILWSKDVHRIRPNGWYPVSLMLAFLSSLVDLLQELIREWSEWHSGFGLSEILQWKQE